MKFTITFVFVIFVAFIPSEFGQSPVATIKAFYQYDRSHSQVFNRRNIDGRKRWFSKEIYNLFLYELKRENEYLKKNPGEKPYFGDGLPFQPYDETCKAGGRSLHRMVVVKPADVMRNRAVVTASFPYPKPCRDTDAPTYTIGLIKQGSVWVIDDLNYGEDRTLKQDLKRKEY
ncbi:MAG TPA: hypothetical protein VEV84_07595 [Pyrinomonadaceae bacterium]|nr:hypothetical protein [Pyrinomonadaceae bacterium]